MLAERRSGWSTPSTRIDRGEFPPTPDDVFRCDTCSFAAVCRKDYVGDCLTARRPAHAVDPSQNVVLEASAGTGKTRVLVERYVNLLRAGVDPEHILAITFTRKAAAEMRERIIERLTRGQPHSRSSIGGAVARARDRLGDIAISTIDAFCLSLLREFPLEADVDPGFDLADQTEVAAARRRGARSALRICRRLAADRRRCGAGVRAAGRAAAAHGPERAARAPAGGAAVRCGGFSRAGRAI